MTGRRAILGRLAACALSLLALQAATPVAAQPLASADIRIVGLGVDIDTRPDLPGIQSTRTAVKDFPSAVLTVVGAPGAGGDAPPLPPGAIVLAELTGPGIGGGRAITLAARANGFLEIPPLPVAGEYTLSNVRVEAGGAVLLRRAQGPGIPAIVIRVIDELLVTELTSRPLSVDEIRERGIVIDESSFTAFEFTLGLMVESTPVRVAFPVTIPTRQSLVDRRLPTPQAPAIPRPVPIRIPGLEIPNLMIQPFGLERPPFDEPELPTGEATLPGIIVIPGDVAFLNQFFSVLLMVSNAAPAGSGIRVNGLEAEIALPRGGDGIAGTGDDPLRVAATGGGAMAVVPIVRTRATATGQAEIAHGETSLEPGDSGQGEFLVEGLAEGTHAFEVAIRGELQGFRSGARYPVSATVPGSVLVRNPDFSLTIAHPQIVRVDEPYTVFVTATNTSAIDANLFSLAVDARSLNGTRLAPGEAPSRSLPVLAAGSTETFAIRMVSQVTGQVAASVLLTDEGLSGRLLLTLGVTEEGVPLSPDTIVLPALVDFLPEPITRAALRLLGQAWSVATAPGGALPEGVERMRRDVVLDRAAALADAGLRLKFGDGEARVLDDLLFDWLGETVMPLDDEDPDDTAARQRDVDAFDALRRGPPPGRLLADAFADALAGDADTLGVLGVQRALAAAVRHRAPHVSVAVDGAGGPAPVRFTLSDPAGRALGNAGDDGARIREIPAGEILDFGQGAPGSRALAVVARPRSGPHAVIIEVDEAATGGFDLAVAIPDGDTGQRLLTWHDVPTVPGATVTLAFDVDGVQAPALSVDVDGDGAADALAPVSDESLPDPGPSIVAVQHWAEGVLPRARPTLRDGDPLGREIAVLLSEPVEPDAAESVSSWRVDAIPVGAVGLQDNGRLAFVFLQQPIRPPPDDPGAASPFVPHTLRASNLADLRGNPIEPPDAAVPVAPNALTGPGALLSGTVRRADGTPLPFATVTCWNFVLTIDGARSVPVSQVTADANGRYGFEFVLQSGYGPFSVVAEDPETSVEARVTTRVQFDGQRRSLDVVVPGFGTVVGRVLDPGGNPVPDAAVTLRALTPGLHVEGTPGGTRAGADGRFRLDRVPVGNFSLEAVDPATGAIGRAAGTIAAAGATREVDVRVLALTGGLRLRVLDADRATPAAGVSVLVSAGPSPPLLPVATPIALEETDAAGTVEVLSLPAGPFEIEVLDLATGRQARASGTVPAGDVRDVALVLPAVGATVRGTVLGPGGQPVIGAPVRAGLQLTETDAQGRFAIGNLVVGEVEVVAADPARTVRASTRVTLLSAADVQDVVLSLPAVTRVGVSGTVHEADGVTPAAYVPVYFLAGGVAVTETDEDGHYRFDDVPVELPVQATLRSSRGTRDGGETRTRFTFDGEQRSADIVFRGRGSIGGRVVQASNGVPVIADVAISRPIIRIVEAPGGGLGIASATVRAVLGVEEPESVKLPIFTSDQVMLRSDQTVPVTLPNGDPALEPTGRFTLDSVLAGPFRVVAGNALLRSAAVESVIPKTTVASARVVDVGDILLATDTGEVSGTVFMPDGVTPVGENVAVTLDGSLGALDVTTDETGRYRFALVRVGPFTVRADTGAPFVPATGAADVVTSTFAGLNARLHALARGTLRAGGDAIEVDLRLRDAGALAVRVVANDGETPVPFAKVKLMTTFPLDEESATELNADAGGRIDLFPVVAGEFTVSARDPGTAAPGLASANLPDEMPDGYTRPVLVTLGAVSTPAGTSDAAGVGTVRGTVFDAQGVALDRVADVLVRTGRDVPIAATTDLTGRYEVGDVPVGPFTVDVVDRFTARQGHGTGAIAFDGDAQTVDVDLEGLGRVVGELRFFDGTAPSVPATVTLRSDGDFTRPIVSQTDANARFEFVGVPVAPYELTAREPITGLTGSARDAVAADGDVVTTDVVLAPAVAVTGRVLDHLGRPVEGATVIRDPGRPPDVRTQSGPGGRYRFDHVPVGAHPVLVRAPSGNDAGADRIDVTVADALTGVALDVDLSLAGTGTLQGRVLDSAGVAAVENARVALGVLGAAGATTFTRFTGADGRFALNDVPSGSFSLGVTTTVAVPPLGASAAGDVDPGGVDLGDLRLEPAGTVVGRILRPDGTAAPGAVASVERAGLALTATADALGRFAIDALPLATYRVVAIDRDGPGRLIVAADVTANGQVVGLGDLALDAEPPRVLAVEPADGATGVDPGAPVTITLSEPLAPASVTAQTVTVSTPSGPVDGTLALVDAPPAVTFTPAAPLPDLTPVTVTVRREQLAFGAAVDGVEDRAGFSLMEDVTSRYTTGDSTAPRVTGLSPAPDATGVALRSVVRIAFDEPVDRASIASFGLSADGVPVPGSANTQPILGDTVVVFTPAAALAPDTRYEVRLTGPVTDRAGNPQPDDVLTYAFSTLDTIAPAVVGISSSAGAAAAVGSQTTLSADVGAASDVATVEFFVNGALIARVDAPPYRLPLILAPALGSPVRIAARAVDRSGNVGTAATLDIDVLADDPPAAVVVSPAAGTAIASGTDVDVVVDASDDLGLSSLGFSASGAVRASASTLAGGAPAARRVFRFTVPPDAEPGAAVDLSASATDTAGQGAASAVRRLTVRDATPPSAVLLTPSVAAVVDPGTLIAIHVQANDNGPLASIGYRIEGAFQTGASRPPGAGARTASAAFAVAVPPDAPPGGQLRVIGEASDLAGQRAETSPVVLVLRDSRAPVVTAIEADGGATTVALGATLGLTVRATDEVGVSRIDAQAGPGSIAPPSRAFAAGTTGAAAPFTLTAPDDPALAGTPVDVTARAFDDAGNVSAQARASLTLVDGTAPGVVIASPAPGASVVPGATVTVDVDATDAVGVTRIRLRVTGAAAFEDEAVLAPSPSASRSFSFDVPPDAATAADVTLTATAVDAAGNEASQSLMLVVADVVPPRVLSVLPGDGAVDVAPGARVQVTFDEPIAAGSATASNVTLEGPGGAAVAATVGLAGGGRTVTLTPLAPLDPGTAYDFSIATGLTDVSGNALAAPFRSRFETLAPDVQGPTVVAVTPADGSQGASITTPVSVRFSEPVAAPGPGADVLRVVPPGAGPVSGRLEQPAPDRLRFVPAAPLPLDAAIAVEVGPGITDLAGNPLVDAGGTPLTAPLLFGFTTGAFAITGPRDGTTVPESTPVVLQARASAALGVASVVFSVDGSPIAPVAGPAFTAVVTAPAKADAGTLVIGASARDARGNEIATDSVTVGVGVAMTLAPRLLGVPQGEVRDLTLRLSSALADDLEVVLAASAPGVVNVAPAVTVPAGAQRVDVPIGGLAPGSALLLAESALGRAGATVSVGTPDPDAQPPLLAPAVGLGLLPPPSAGSVVLAPGAQVTLALRVLDAPAPAPLAVGVSSDAPEVATIAAPSAIASGEQVVSVTVTAGVEGSATVTLAAGAARRALTVVVGTPPDGSVPPALAPAVGLAALPPPSAGTLVLSEGAARSPHVRLLSTPAGEPVPVTVSGGDPAVATVTGPVVVPAGARTATLPIVTAGPGTVELLLTAGTARVALTIVVGTPPTGAVAPALAAPVGLNLLPLPSAGEIVLPPGGAQTLRVRLLSSPVAVDTPVVVSSSDPAIASPVGAAVVLAGEEVATLTIDAGAAGRASLLLAAGSERRSVGVTVGDPLPGAVPPALAPPVGIDLLPRRDAGTAVVAPGTAVTLRVPILTLPAPGDTIVTIATSDAAVAAPQTASAVIPAGDLDAEFTLVTGATGRAALTLDGGRERFVVTVIVGAPPDEERPTVIAPPVGIE